MIGNGHTFNQAIDRYQRDLLNQQKQFPYAQAFGEYSKLTRTGSFDTEALIKAAKTLTLADLHALKQSTLANNNLRVFSYGNYNQKDIDAIAAELAAILPSIKVSGVAKRTLYSHFESKEALILAALEQRHQIFMADLFTCFF